MASQRHLSSGLTISLALVASIVLALAAQHFPAPDFTLNDTSGNTFALSDYEGHVVILDFMATWCGPCKVEISHLNGVNERFEDEIVIISISVDPYYDTNARLRTFMDQYDINWTMARDMANVTISYAVRVVPTLIIVNGSGYVRYRHDGVTGESQLSQEIEVLLNESKGSEEPEPTTTFIGTSAFAFTSGLFSLLSPCGFALLPVYVSYRLGSKATIKKAFAGGVVSTVGVLTALSMLGVVASTVGSLIVEHIPSINVVIALIIIALGLATLANIPFPSLRVPSRLVKSKGLLGQYAFGLAYGLGISACTAPIFFSVLAYAVTVGTFRGALILGLYALGMGAGLIAVSVLTAGAKNLALRRISDVTPKIHKLSGLIVLVFGLYLLYQNLIVYR